jgi:hypothetical protein
MLVKYIGPCEAVEVSATGDVVESGGLLEVESALGISLCEQLTNWVPADADAEAELSAFYVWVSGHMKAFDPIAGMDVWVPRPAAEPTAETAVEPAIRRRAPAAPIDSASAATAQEG